MKNYDEVVIGSLDIAQTEASRRKNAELDALHLFMGLLLNPKTWSSKGLKTYKKEAELLLDKLPTIAKGAAPGELRASSSLSSWITYASSLAIQQGQEMMGEPHLLRYIHQVLPALNIDPNVLKNLNSEGSEEEEAPTFLLNLNELAAKGKLDPVIGRDKEIRAVMEILGRRGKNNPVLVGSAGVGKTAIVEGLAEAIHKGSVPDVLKDKIVFSLDMGALMAGTKFRGEFEERMQKLLKFIKGKAGQAVLFIDEIHQLVGAGRTDGAMDAANLLKPALARGELHCIGATTEDEYQKYILGDAALARRFRSVMVKEPSTEDAIEILMGVKEKFEIHHGIKISDEAIYNAVTLSTQYITDKYLPDKAIDLIDESASALKLSAEAMPERLVTMEAEIRGKMILSQVEKDNKKILEEIAKTKKIFEEEKKIWEKEVLSLKQVSELKREYDRLKFALEEAQRKQNYEEASKIKYSQMPVLEKKIEESSHAFILTKKNIAEVIARQTGIPVEKIMKTEQENILQLEGFLKSKVFGQDQALTEVAGTLIASHAGLSEANRPLGSFLLLGPSGVGKTETAKSLAEFLFNTKENMIRMDMSEYSEKHAVAKLIGAPAGYVGYDEGGVLTEAVRRRPYSVILFDEIEKAHEDFADILLQIMDDGRLTDNKGRTVSFRNTIIFLTSNAKDYRKQFKPEVLGRIDSILQFKALTGDVGKKLIEKLLLEINERLRDKGLSLRLSPEVVDELQERGIDEAFGARPLKSAFANLVTRPLSVLLLKGELPSGEVIANWNKTAGKIEFEFAKLQSAFH